MKGRFSRRSLLAGAGCALAGTTAGQLLAVARGQEAAQARQGQPGAGICLTMAFENAARASFDPDKYVKRHLPLLREVYGDSVERIELRTAAGASMNVPSAVLATTTLWIRDVPAFSHKLGANADRINKDLDSVAKGNRLVQPDRIVFETGEPRADVPANSHVFSLFYPARSPATTPSLDAGYFTGVFLPKMYSLYGAGVIRRLEATVGMDQGGQKAAHLAAYHLFIRDRGAYDQRQGAVFGEMQKDAAQFTTIFPLFADLRVTAIA